MDRLAEISFSNARSNVMISAEFLDICIVAGWFGFSGRLWTYIRDGRLLDKWCVSLLRIIICAKKRIFWHKVLGTFSLKPTRDVFMVSNGN